MTAIELNILTLNVWGIPFVSSDRHLRVPAIIDELSTGKYDVVSLQEVWSQSDVQLLKDGTDSVLPYSHYFYSGVIGAGLLVLSKYAIIGTLFHAWSVNGYFHRIQHADWFGGKGVGLCRILIGNHILHLYNAHLHAEYNNENDEYKTHRVIQAYDTAQFIEATRGNSALQILAGDLNSKPDDVTYKILLQTSKMRDCCKSSTLFTNECARNSYTPRSLLSRNPHGIRIDHIFMRSGDHIQAEVVEHSLPFPDRVPGQKFSFSDHEAVLTRVQLREVLASNIREVPNSNIREVPNSNIPRAEDITVSLASNGDAATCDRSNGPDAVTPPMEASSSNHRELAVLGEAIDLCERSLKELKTDRIMYYSVALVLTVVLVVLAELSPPIGIKTLSLLMKLFVWALVLFSLFMGSLWNYMERNGILAGMMAMKITENQLRLTMPPTTSPTCP